MEPGGFARAHGNWSSVDSAADARARNRPFRRSDAGLGDCRICRLFDFAWTALTKLVAKVGAESGRIRIVLDVAAADADPGSHWCTLLVLCSEPLLHGALRVPASMAGEMRPTLYIVAATVPVVTVTSGCAAFWKRFRVSPS